MISILILILIGKSTCQDMTYEQKNNYLNFLANQKRLIKDLFDDYDPGISAIYTLRLSDFTNGSIVHPPPLELKLTMSMLKLVDVVEVEEKVTFLFDYMTDWVDERLKWDPLDYGGISHIYVPRAKVWIPEVTISDAHEVKIFENDEQKIAWISFNGSIGYYVSTVSSVICQLDVYKFPMDKHLCSVNILYHSYETNEYRITSLMENFPKPLSMLGNGEWDVTWIGVAEEAVYSNYSAIQRFEAKFSRNAGFYIALVIIPAYFINILTVIAIFMDIENISDKFQVGLTNIMAMTFILVILAADLPKTQKIPLLAIYVINSLVIMISSIGAVLLILKFKKILNKHPNNEKSVRFGCIGRIFGRIRIEYYLMIVFLLAHLINLIVLFL